MDSSTPKTKRTHCKHTDFQEMSVWRCEFLQRQFAASGRRGKGLKYTLAQFARDLQAEKESGRLVGHPPCYSTLKKYMKILREDDKDFTYFPACGHRIKTRKVNQDRKSFGPFPREDTCFNCLVTERQEQEALGSKVILSCLESAKKYIFVSWSGPVHEICVAKQAAAFDVPEWLANDLQFQYLWSVNFGVRKLDLDKPPASDETMDALKWGKHPGQNEFTYDDDAQILENPGDGTVGLVTWPTWDGYDFAMIDTLRLINEDVVAISRDETKISCRLSRESYFNDAMVVTNTKEAKRRTLKCNPSMIRKTVAEMKSRVRALAVTSYFKLDVDSKGQIWQSLQEAILTCNNSNVRQLWLFVDSSLSMLDIVLLEYACGTDEMRCYQALHAHTGTKGSHFIESMTLFGRVPDGDTRGSCTVVKQMETGLLCLIWQGFAFKIRCGRDVMHLQLANTMHVANSSYGYSSWLHGP